MPGYDPFSHEVMQDPWPFYAQLRADAPVFYLEKYDAWFLSRFEDIRASTTNDVRHPDALITPKIRNGANACPVRCPTPLTPRVTARLR